MTTQTTIENVTDTDEKTSHYPMFKVIVLNDDKTPMDFVVAVLVRFFNKDINEAMRLMLEVHNTGSGLAGVYIFEQAEFKVDQVHSLARGHKLPLTLSIEPA